MPPKKSSKGLQQYYIDVAPIVYWWVNSLTRDINQIYRLLIYKLHNSNTKHEALYWSKTNDWKKTRCIKRMINIDMRTKKSEN